MNLAKYLVALTLFAGMIGCASRHEQGVKSNYRQQWTAVAADTKTTTEAARAVLEERELIDLTATATAGDGVASGKPAAGRRSASTSRRRTPAARSRSPSAPSATALAAELASEIKARAEPRGVTPALPKNT